jgi:hypothetical protein
VGISTAAAVSVTFSAPVTGTGGASLVLEGPTGRPVEATVAYDPLTLKATLTPAAPLRDSATYRVSVRPGIVGMSGTRVPPESWTFTTVRRAPSISLGGARRQSARRVLATGLRIALRSRDRDRVLFSLEAHAGRARVGSRRGAIAAGIRRLVDVRLSSAARRKLRAGRSLSIRLIARVRDPAGNARSLGGSFTVAS